MLICFTNLNLFICLFLLGEWTWHTCMDFTSSVQTHEFSGMLTLCKKIVHHLKNVFSWVDRIIPTSRSSEFYLWDPYGRRTKLTSLSFPDFICTLHEHSNTLSLFQVKIKKKCLEGDGRKKGRG